MAIYDPIVPRPRGGDRRTSGNLPDSLQRALYQEMLTEELGRRPEGFVPAEPEGKWRDLLPAIVGMLILALLALTIAYVVMLWRAGEFDGWMTGERITAAQRAWQREDRARRPEDAAPDSSPIEDMLEKSRTPPAEQPAAAEPVSDAEE